MKNSPFLALLVLACVTACASLGLAPAQNFDQQLAYAYGTHTAVLQATTAAVTSGALSKPDGATVLSLADQSRTLLDSAKAVESTDANTAQNKLTLALAVLNQLQAYLQSKGIK